MAYLKIPVRSDLPAYEFQIELEKKIYFLSFNWNSRIGKWFMDIKDADQLDIIRGVKLLTSWPILYRFKDIRLPLGTFMVVDTANKNADPGVADLGNRHILMYRESTTVD